MDKQKDVNATDICSCSCSQSQDKRQQNVASTVCLTEDIIFFNILTRLPATFLFSSARLVCKAWAAIICKTQFVDAHLRHAKSGVFLQSTRPTYGARFLEFKDNGAYQVTRLSSKYPGRILNSCDGLSLFLQYSTGALHVSNPVTNQEERVPYLLGGENLMYPPCAIARVPHGEFKLFAANVEKQAGVSVCHWYVLRLGIDNSWRKIGTESGDFDFKCIPIYTGGYDLYWVTERRVIVMDVAKETFKTFQLPQELQWHPHYLKMGDHLSSIVFVEQGFQVYIFEPKSGKWTLYHQIGHLNYPNGHEVLSEFFCVWVNQEVIIKSTLAPSLRTLIFGYNVKTRNLRMLDAIEVGAYDLAHHSNSLVTWKTALP
ncbi:hypothetical protein HN51_046646 [Arachis hypogaea]|uniref:uncharacterized protein LOC107624825 n=1 Tax=Arachis ipaensis TaxID=130454 RepID=UPI0007AF2BFB|nr:uncharacterized protein LOC107624825 [Arachis ipaensis]XP_016182776.1 uncharacterized protein LOC107624825 [Arachis ipaensis]XP_016182777.1 uncharacterized protein LOC107624825 [Arachis ipaensis]XP_020971037.1 uncharacterized protein LOC107624825 [Arachis ipaensis]XP_025632065.1 uncharacterized protein LOC112726762 [Arachis hypogaea]XP_025632066.1 uncharacterized protein LOC112726762 [Arachis hypogaea]XP_025632067.1 uncharacterized protein LOC112726762 [Arachis hypogaea]XP_029146394.1 unc